MSTQNTAPAMNRKFHSAKPLLNPSKLWRKMIQCFYTLQIEIEHFIGELG